jgi:hypothetical protein
VFNGGTDAAGRWRATPRCDFGRGGPGAIGKVATARVRKALSSGRIHLDPRIAGKRPVRQILRELDPTGTVRAILRAVERGTAARWATRGRRPPQPCRRSYLAFS